MADSLVRRLGSTSPGLERAELWKAGKRTCINAAQATPRRKKTPRPAAKRPSGANVLLARILELSRKTLLNTVSLSRSIRIRTIAATPHGSRQAMYMKFPRDFHEAFQSNSGSRREPIPEQRFGNSGANFIVNLDP